MGTCAPDAASFPKARFKGRELKLKLAVRICESFSETLDSLTCEAPASFPLLRV